MKKKMSLSNEFYFIFLSMFHLVLQGLFFLGKTHLGNNHEPACLFWLSVMMNSTNKGLVQSVCLYLCVIVVSHQPPPVRSLCWDEENPKMVNWTKTREWGCLEGTHVTGNQCWKGHNRILSCHHRRKMHQKEGGWVNLMKIEGWEWEGPSYWLYANLV